MSLTEQYTTFADLFTGVLNAVRSQTTQTATISQAKRAVNVGLQDMHLGRDYQFYWAERQSRIIAKPPYRVGTISLAAGLTLVVGTGTLWNTSATYGGTNVIVGGKITFPGSEVVYRVASVIDDTHLTLDSIYVGSTLTAETYTYFEDEYAMPTDYLRPVDMQFFDDDREIQLVDRRQMRRALPRNSITGRPCVATQIELGPSGNTLLRPRMVFAPPPDAVYNIPFSYITSDLAVSATGDPQTNLLADTDEPIVPLRYRHALYYFALTVFYQHKDDVRRAEADAQYRDIMVRTLGDVTVGDRQVRMEPQVTHYVAQAKRPYSGGGRSRRFDTESRAFDRLG